MGAMGEGRRTWPWITEDPVQNGYLGQREECWISGAEEVASKLPKSSCIGQNQEICSQGVSKMEISKVTLKISLSRKVQQKQALRAQSSSDLSHPPAVPTRAGWRVSPRQGMGMNGQGGQQRADPLPAGRQLPALRVAGLGVELEGLIMNPELDIQFSELRVSLCLKVTPTLSPKNRKVLGPCYGLNCVSPSPAPCKESYEILTPGTLECGLVWNWGLCRCN